MADRDEIRRLAQEHVALYTGDLEPDVASWVERRWAPDIGIHLNIMDTPMTRDQWVQAFIAEHAGLNSHSVRLEATRVIVDDDAFVLQLQVNVVGPAFPICLVFTVSDGKCVRLDEYLDASRFTA